MLDKYSVVFTMTETAELLNEINGHLQNAGPLLKNAQSLEGMGGHTS